VNKHLKKSVRKRPAALTLTVLLIIAASLVLIAINGLQIWDTRQDEFKEGQIDTVNLARSLAQHAEHTFGEADTLLIGLVERLESTGNQSREVEALQPLLNSYLNHLDQLQTITITNEYGQPIIATNPFSLKANVADRAYFQFHQHDTQKSAHIDSAIRSRSYGTWVITISRRYNHSDGTFAGIVLASITMAYFQSFYDSFDIKEGGSAGLLLDDGTLLARRPYKESLIGINLLNKIDLKNSIKSINSGTLQKVSPLDNVNRIYAYRHVNDYPLIAFAALSEKAVLAEWTANTRRYAIGTGAAIIMLSCLGFLLYRQIQAVVKTEQQLRKTQHALQNANAELAEIAHSDSLTGLGNRRYFDASLEEELKRALRSVSPLSLILIDIDYFKRYNDTYGHLAGDECLQKVSHALKQCLQRPADTAFRYGGEELAVLLPGTDTKGALLVAEKIQQTTRTLEIAHTGSPTAHITISIGVHGFIPTQEEHGPGYLIQAADKALYLAKANGRNRVCTYDEASPSGSS